MHKSLAKAELAVMNLLWHMVDRLTAREIRERLYPDETKAQHGTVQRLLQRLEDKGFVNRDKRLSTHSFSPALSLQDYAGQRLESLAHELTDDSFVPLLAHLIAQKKVSREDVERMRDVLDSYEKDTSS